MYLSYHLHPVLQLLDDDRCEEYVNSPKCELLHALLHDSREKLSDADGLDGQPRDEFINIVGSMLADGFLAERIKKIYYPSKAFDMALEKSRKAFDKLIRTPSVLMDVHEDCCFLMGVNRRVKMFLVFDHVDHEGWSRYRVIEAVDNILTFWAEFSLKEDSDMVRYNFIWEAEIDYENVETEDVEKLWWRLEIVYGYLVFKRYSDVEMEEVVREKTLKKSTILRDKVNNFMGINVTLLDSRWFTTICRNEGFAVSGHFRLQPYKDGQRKLIYIAPFMKTGYHRQAKIEKEKE